MSQMFVDIRNKIRDLLNVPRQLAVVSEKLEQQSDTIAKASERTQQEHTAQNERLENILIKNDQTEKNKPAKNDPYYRVQNWIRWGTWAAVFSASAYAGVTAFQWRDANRNFIISQRAWMGVNGAVKIDSISTDQKGAKKVSFTVLIKNYGNSVALDVGISAEVIDGLGAMDSASSESCKTAAVFSNLKDMTHIQNLAAIEIPKDISPGLIFQGDGSTHSFPDSVIQTGRVPIGLTIVGCIVYRDQFGKMRRTRLCYGEPGAGAVTAGSLLYPCVVGTNDAE
jgi:hypothetical protein